LSGFDLQDVLATRGLAPPIIFITGHDDFIGARTRAPGACGCLRKPFETSALLTLLRPHLSFSLSE
jgi:FixJ family two-component response regulator